MKSVGRYALMVTVLTVGLIAWTGQARAQEGPPPDDAEWLDFGMGMGPGFDDPGPPPAPGMGMGPGAGMGDRDFMARGHKMGRGPQAREQALEKIKQEDPERYERIMKIKELSREYRNTDDPKRQKEIEKELRPLIDKELKTQHENNKKRLAEMEKRIEHMKKVLKQREENWDEVVDFAVKEATGQNDYLKAWRGGRGHKKR